MYTHKYRRIISEQMIIV